MPPSGTDILIDNGNTGVNAVVTINSNAVLGNVTIDAGDTLQISDNRTVTITGTAVINNGNFGVNSAGNGVDLRLNTSVVFSGTGTLSLSNFSNNRVLGNSSAFVLTNQAGHTIQGAGQIGADSLQLLNRGTVDANLGNALVIDTAGDMNAATATLVNSGTLRASAGGTLVILNTRVDNFEGVTAGTIRANTGSTVSLQGARIVGGNLTTAGTGAINLTAGSALRDLTITAGSTVTATDNSTVRIDPGTITNDGTFRVNSAGNGVDLRLSSFTVGSDTVTLGGSGVLQMSNFSNNRILADDNQDVLVNASTHTIRGSGQIGVDSMRFRNQGLVEATGSAGLVIDTAGDQNNPSATLINQATLQSNGGTLTIQNSRVDNTGGVIQAQIGSTTVISNSRITGGSLTTVGSGAISLANQAALGNLTITAGSTVTVFDNQIGRLDPGTITNNGTLLLNSVGNGADLRLNNLGGAGETVTLGGTGVLQMSNSSNNRLLADDNTDVIVNASTPHDPRSGRIGADSLVFRNQGLVEATASFGLTIDTTGDLNNLGVATLINEATLQSNGGTLAIQNSRVDNAGGVIQAQAGSTTVISNSRIVGGSLTTLGDGSLNLVNGATLANVTITAGSTVTVVDGHVARLDPGSITNNGTLLLNSAGNGVDLRLNSFGGAGEIVTLGGTGVLLMSNNNTNRILADDGADIIVNASTHTIRGAGRIGADSLVFRNQGLVEATAPVGLTIDTTGDQDNPSATLINQATLQSNGGTLTIQNSRVDNTGGVIRALDGSTTVIAASRVSGGDLTTLGSGAIALASNASLQNLTITGGSTVTVFDNNTGRFDPGTITNNGTLLMASVGNFTQLRLNNATAGVQDTVTLSGTGVLQMSSSTANVIAADENGDRIINAAGHTIRGSGQIGLDSLVFQNQGLVEATSTGGLTIDTTGNLDNATATLINSATLQSNGGTLTILNSRVDNAGGTIQAQAGSTTTINNSRIVGGSLTTIGTGVVSLVNQATLNNLTITSGSTVTVADNNVARLDPGTITNDGTLLMASVGNGTELRLNNATAGVQDTVTLSGTGVLQMSNSTANRIFADENGDRIINAAGHTIRGSGQIGVNSLVLRNEGLVEATTAAGLTIDTTGDMNNPTATLVNVATLQSNGGTLTILNSRVDNTGGTIRALAGSATTINNSRIVGGSLTTIGNGALNLVNQATLNNLTITAGSTVTVVDNNVARLDAGTITNNGTLQMASVGNGTELRLNSATASVQDTVTLSGTGVLQMSNTTANRIFADESGDRIVNAAGHTIRGSGQIGVNSLVLRNEGTIVASSSAGLFIDPTGTAGDASTVNTGTLRADGGTLTLQGGNFDNQGTVEALNGSTVLYSTDAAVANNAAGVLTGGIWRASGNGSTITLRGADIATNQAEIILDQAGSVIQVAGNSIDNTLSANGSAGTLRILGNRNFTATANAGSFANSGVVQLGGGTFAATALANTQGTAGSEIFGFGAINTAGQITGNGTIRAAGGTLTVQRGVANAGATLRSDAGATLNLASAAQASVVGTLINNGALALGSQNVTVNVDYNNANFGTGNAFDRRANVTGAGQILASGTTQQTLSGNVLNGTSAAPTLDFGNVRVGTVTTLNYQVNNVGSGGPSLRGAIQTAANGGSLTAPTLTGTGVTAGNFGPIAQGGNSGPYAVTFTPTAGGALSGQSVAIVNNFDNVSGQVLSVTGTAWNVAQGAATPDPIALGNFRVGVAGGPTQAVTVANTAVNNGFSERLGIQSAGVTGNFSVTNNLGAGLVNAGANQANALNVAVAGGVAGANAGQLSIQYTSDGTGTSGLAAIASNSQTIAVSATGFNVAQASVLPASPIVFGDRHVGDAATQALSIANTAPTGAFTERLNASFGAPTGAATTNGGSIALLTAGAPASTAMSVGLDTSVAGARSGQVTVNLQSDGTGTSGLGTLNLTGQTVSVQGNVYRLAQANTIAAVNFGNVHVGDSVQQALSVSNLAANDGFSERLNASFGGVSDARITTAGTITQLAAGSTNNTSLVVGLNTAAAGTVNGTATVNLQSDGTGINSLGVTNLASQNVGVSGTIQTSGSVYRLASPLINTAQPVDFGNRRVGDSVGAVALSITNNVPNDGFSESLNAAAGTGTNGVTVSGSFNLLGAGQTNTSGVLVGISTATAGSRNGTATVAFVSDGTGTSGLGQTNLASQNVSVTGAVFRLAQGDATPNPIDLGSFRVGVGGNSQAVTVANTAAADGFSERLGIQSAGVTGNFALTNNLGSGLINAGANQANALNVALSGGVAGANTGQLNVQYLSDGTGTSGFSAIAANSQTIAVSATGWNVAQADLSPNPIALAARRVGDAAATGTLTIANTAAAGVSESLVANVTSTPAGFAVTGGTNPTAPIAAGGSTARTVSLSTATAGAFSGNVGIGLTSTGTGTSGLADLALAGQNVAVSGNVYAAAVATPSQTTVDFGTVRRGASVAAQTVGVTNTASGGLTDTLVGNGGSASGPFGIVNNLAAPLAAGAGNANALSVSLNTANAGVFGGTAQANFLSRNAEMADLGVSASIGVSATVNDLANPVFQRQNGLGFTNLSGGGLLFSYDFGDVQQGSTVDALSMRILNDVLGPADALNGSFAGFDTGAGPGGTFSFAGFNPFAGIAAGAAAGGFLVGLDTSDPLGLYQGGFTFLGLSHLDGFDDVPITVTVQFAANIVAAGPTPVPEPAALPVLAGALVALGLWRRRRPDPRGRAA